MLGLVEYGLEETATKVEGRTLMEITDWKGALQRAIDDPLTRFTVSLDGLSGSSPSDLIMTAVQNGSSGIGRATEWELAQLYAAGRLLGADFVEGGKIIKDAFG